MKYLGEAIMFLSLTLSSPQFRHYGGFICAVLLLLSGGGCRQGVPSDPEVLPQVHVSQSIEKEVTEWDEYTGYLEATESVEIRARVSGYLASIHFQDGQTVEKGDLLFVIDPRPAQAALAQKEAQLKEGQARLDLALNREKRAQSLLKEHAISEEDYDTRNKELQKAEASLHAIGAEVQAARLDLEDTRVVSPLRGKIGRHLVSVGNLIQGGNNQATLLARIVSIDLIYCYINSDEASVIQYFQLAQEGKRPSMDQGKLPAELALAHEKGYPHQGHIDFIDNELDSTTGTLQLRAVFQNTQQQLKPGFFARMRIPGSPHYQALLVKNDALGSFQNRRFVLVVNEKEIVEQRFVEVGSKINGWRVIRSGLKPKEWVIIQGLTKVHPGDKVEAIREDSSSPNSQAELSL